MASLSTDSAGSRKIQFSDAGGKRRTVYLGKLAKKQAETVQRMIESLVSARITRTAPPDEVSRWLASLDDSMTGKLSAVGLCDAPKRATLELFVAEYIASRVDVKPNTVRAWKQAETHLVEFFGAECSIRAMTKGDGKAFRLHLLGKRLSEATVRKFCGFAKHFLESAVEHEIITRNPFDDVPSSSIGNEKRQQFVTREEISAVLAACSDHEWRLAFALSRFGGLRVPSEFRELKWADVNWEHSRMLVKSPKTERIIGHAERVVPLYPELLPFLLESSEQAEPGEQYVLPRLRMTDNLRSSMTKTVRRAGLVPWPRITHNMRSSRQTELESEFPSHVVCKWMGNSQQIAKRHYLQTRDIDFEKAIATPTGQATQNPTQPLSATTGNDPNAPAEAPRKLSQTVAVQHVTTGADGNRTHPAAFQPPPRV